MRPGSLPEREAMALGRDGNALDRSRYARSGQRLPTLRAGLEAHRNKNSPHRVIARKADADKYRFRQRPLRNVQHRWDIAIFDCKESVTSEPHLAENLRLASVNTV
jgi:hypothetical protein